MAKTLASLVALTRALGAPARDYVIVGEGNTSMRLDDTSFAVKASGQQMANIAADGFVALRLAPLLDMLEQPPATLSEEKSITQAALLNPGSGRSPSIEASFHAALLQDCEVDFVGHTHPTAVNQVLCSAYAADFAAQRRFPDEVVLCGPQSLLIPYADPGLPLALLLLRPADLAGDRASRRKGAP